MLINTFIIGVQKAGTTALYSFLKQHPDITFGHRKELHIFDNETIEWSYLYDPKTKNKFAETLTQTRFPNRNTAIICDATPSYICIKQSIERIHLYNPQAKIIMLL